MRGLKGPLPRWVVPAAVGAGGLIVLALGWSVVISPLKGRIGSLQDQTAQTQAQIAERIAAAHPESSATSTPAIHVADIYRIAKAMPSIADLPDVLIELNQTALESGVTLQTISPGGVQPDPSGTFASFPVTVDATGDFYRLTDLLYRLRNLVSVRNGSLEAAGRLFSVQSVSFQPFADSTKLKANIDLDAYVYGTVGPDGTLTPPAASTDTTSTTDTTSSGPTAAGATP